MSEQSLQVKTSKDEAVTSSEPNLGTTTIQGPPGMNFSKSDKKDNLVIDVPTHTYPRLYLGTKKCPRKSVLVTFYKC